MKKVYESLQELPDGLPLHFMYRSTMSGHENCDRFHYPVTRDHPVAKNPTGTRNRTYHWHWFTEYNAFAKELWGYGPLALNHNGVSPRSGGDDLEWRAKVKKGGRTITTGYWDVWDMSVTRPDAHIAWNGNSVDCLHVSVAGQLVPRFR